MKYLFNQIETKWQKYWAENQSFKAKNKSEKPKFYVLDMFPYPSGAGLHVGHPLGYIASDIYARYKRHKGFNVLHPMGYDSFGLPAEQYAIQTGQHPAKTTEENIATYRRQMDQIGFSFDWSREIRTSNSDYYKHTQWIFTELFNSYYCRIDDKALPISELISELERNGNSKVKAVCDADTPIISATEWKAFSEIEKQEFLLKYRLTYLSDTEVNWCPALGTVLANDEIVNGVSERGGHPVEQKKMKQWSMRITAYAQRLLNGLQTIDWPQPLKDSQTNWIGRSEGAMVSFKVIPNQGRSLPPTPSKRGGAEARYKTSDSEIYRILLERAKEMRKNPTDAEAKLWDIVRNRKLGFKFRRQHPIADFIVDFVCIEKGLIIEVDGEIHQYQVSKDYDRQLLLEEKKGYKVIRFTNAEVLNNTEEVIDRIKSELNELSQIDNPVQFNDKINPLSFGEGWGEVKNSQDRSKVKISVFTTRPDTIFGISFMTLAPEHELVAQITTEEYKDKVAAYKKATAKRSERDRMADVKNISGQFTGAYAEHPFTKEPIPIWVGDYVLASYGTGAVMAVPAGDQRDFDFATHFGLPIPPIFKDIDTTEQSCEDKSAILTNSKFLNDLPVKKAIKRMIFELEQQGIGFGKINFRLRDAVFSRQRYWGEPFPVYYKDGMPQIIAQEHLPILLPEVEKYLPTEDGKPPLGNALIWAWDSIENKVVSNEKIDHKTVFPLELNTMPGWAGSSWYFNRYMDAKNPTRFASKEALDYWREVDLYIGGSEHATGHLLYARFWQKFLFDRGYAPVDEFAKKLINQGMILGSSAFVYKFNATGSTVEAGNDSSRLVEIDDLPTIIVSGSFYEKYLEYNNIYYKYIISKDEFEQFKIKHNITEEEWKPHKQFVDLISNEIYNARKIGRFLFDDSSFQPIRIDLVYLENPTSDNIVIDKFIKDRRYKEFEQAIFIGEDGLKIKNNLVKSKREVEKMSKSKYNVVNPDDICKEYGADTLRMYEMFLGPLEQAKPWNTAGITGVHGFLKKLWKLFHSGSDARFLVTDEEPSKEELKVLHKTIKKVEEDIVNFSFNTSVSTFMIAVNELTALKSNKRAILEPLSVLIEPYAPHIAEELWEKLGHKESISTVAFPLFKEKYLVESSKVYPISFNGKMRFTMELSLDLSKDEIEKAVLAHEKTQKQLAGRTPKKVIVVLGKIVNIVG